MGLATFLHPMLSRVPREQRGGALREARRTPLDILELIGMAAALIVGLLLARNSESGLPGGIGFGMLAFGLLLLRRTRRGLRQALERL